MKKKGQWMYGELVRKRWGFEERTFTTIVYDNKIPAYDIDNERLEADEAFHIYPDGLKFRSEDIENFELQNEHLFNPEQPAFRRDSKAKIGQWIYGEFLRKRWDISDRLLETFAINGLPAYDNNNKRHDFESGWGCIDIYRFKLKDIEQFERENGHLIRTDVNLGNSTLDAESNSDNELGKRMTVKEVAELLNVDVKTVRANYYKLGGMRLGRQYVFFERRLNNAIQEGTEMDCPSSERGAQTGEGIFDEEGSVDVGSQNEAKTRQRVEQEDRHSLFG